MNGSEPRRPVSRQTASGKASGSLAASEGALGFYRGFLPAVARQCPVILVQMPLIEAIRRAAGLGHI